MRDSGSETPPGRGEGVRGRRTVKRQVCRLFQEVWDGRPLRLLGGFTSRAEKTEYEQLDLFETARSEKQGRLDAAIDRIRQKYGDDSIKRACFLESDVRHMTGGLNKEKRRYSMEKKPGQVGDDKET